MNANHVSAVSGPNVSGRPRQAAPNVEALVRGVFAAIDHGDSARAAAYLTDDVIVWFGNQGPVHGKQSFTGLLDQLLDSIVGIAHTIDELWQVDDAVVAVMQVTYHRADGATVELPCCNIFRLRDGVIGEYRVYVDTSPVFA